MTLEDVKNYIIRKNLDSTTRKRNVIDERIYLYCYIYYVLEIKDLALIGKIFGTKDMHGNLIKAKDRLTVRSALITAANIQFHDTFLKHTKELNDQIPMIIPEYKFKTRNNPETTNIRPAKVLYEVNVKLTRAQFKEYIKHKDPDYVLDILFKYLLEAAPKANKQKKKIDEDNNNQ